MSKNNENYKPVISIKTIEKKLGRTYTDTESTILLLEDIAYLTHRSLNDVLKEIVNNFIENGQIYDPEEEEYYGVMEIVEKHKKNIPTDNN